MLRTIHTFIPSFPGWDALRAAAVGGVILLFAHIPASAVDPPRPGPQDAGPERDAREALGHQLPEAGETGGIGRSIFTRPIRLEGFQRASESLSTFRGQVIVLHFWASWCLPCRPEMSELRRFHETTISELDDLELITVSLDFTTEDLAEFTKDHLPGLPASFRIYWDPNWKVFERFASTAQGLPQTVLVGRDGTIREVTFGRIDWQGDEIHARIEELLAEEPAE